MAGNSRTVLLKKALAWQKKTVHQSSITKVLALSVYFFMGLVTGSVRIFQSINPFGVAMTCCAGGGVAGFVCLMGAAGGYMLSGGALWSVRYLAALIMTYTMCFILQESSVLRKEWFSACACSGLLLGSGVLCYYESLLEITTLVPLLTETLLCAVSVWLFTASATFRDTDNPQLEQRQRGGILLFLGCLLVALSRIHLFGVVNIGRVAAVFVVMAASYGGGISCGCIAGVVAGAAVDVAGAGAPMYTMCYAFSGMLAGTLAQKGRLFFLLCFISANSLTVFWQWSRQSDIAALYEVFFVSVCFMLLPARLLSLLVGTLQKPVLGAGEESLRRYTARRARDMANAFRELYETVRCNAESETNDTDIATVYDRAAEAVCAGCSRKGECWHRDYVDTLSVLNDATAKMRSKGFLESGDLPERFVGKCPSSDAFLDSVNQELRSLIYRRRLRLRLAENRTAAYGQFQYLAGVLDAVSEDLRNASGPDTGAEQRILRYLNARDMDAKVAVFRDQSHRLHVVIDSPRLGMLYRESDYMDKLSSLVGKRMCRPATANQDEGRMVLLEAEPLAVSVGVAALKKEGEPVSGDRGTYFKTEQGVLCVLLSDGMGSGEKAAQQSISVVRILERFLRAGVEPGTAMKILNSVMLLRNGDNWGYATVDLMCVDLFTGKTGFYKYGAAPSFIRHGKTIRRVKGVSMAAGILPGEGEAPDVVRMNLKPGGIALIASDGVISRNNDEWLRTMLLDFDGQDTREFARNVIREAGKQYGYSDDMTVLVVRLEERK